MKPRITIVMEFETSEEAHKTFDDLTVEARTNDRAVRKADLVLEDGLITRRATIIEPDDASELCED